MSDYQIAIPSHRRAERIRDTLGWLEKAGAPMRAIKVFLSDEQDTREYGEQPFAVGGALAFAAERGAFVCTGAKNVVEKFNAIHNYYEPGTRVFVLEDDVTIVESGPGGKPKTIGDVGSLIESGFAACERQRSKLWGIVPHSNPFYFGNATTDTLKLVVAHAFGFIATRDSSLEVTQLGKSDYERTILYWNRYGRVTRVDVAGCKTRSYTAPGGMQSDLSREQRAAAESAACAYLVRRYGHLIKLNTKKASLFAELKFTLHSPSSPSYWQALQCAADARNGYAGA